MAERVFLQPPEIPEIPESKKVIFLGGPIQGAPSWQYEAARLIHFAAPELVVASPRKEYKKGEFVYEKQVDWETHCLARAAMNGVILFWLPRQTEPTPGRAYAQTSRFELGEWKRAHQQEGASLVVGIEKGFGNERYIRRRLTQDCPDAPILDSLTETCFTAVGLAKSEE